MKELIINLCPTGMIPTKEMTRHVPISPDEIAKDVLRCVGLGVSMVHIHPRDEHGEPTTQKESYSAIIKKIREKDTNVVICATTSGRRDNTFEGRSQVLELEGDLKPDMASLTLSSLNFNKQASMNSPDMIQSLAKKMLEKGIKPELEVFDIGMINYAKYLIKKDLLKPPYYFNLLLGNIACAQADLINVGLMIRELPENSVWSLAGIGNSQLQINSLGVVWNCGVRVGLEDNIWLDAARTQLASNEQLVKRIVDLAHTFGRPIITSEKLREYLGLGVGNGYYGAV